MEKFTMEEKDEILAALRTRLFEIERKRTKYAAIESIRSALRRMEGTDKILYVDTATMG